MRVQQISEDSVDNIKIVMNMQVPPFFGLESVYRIK